MYVGGTGRKAFELAQQQSVPRWHAWLSCKTCFLFEGRWRKGGSTPPVPVGAPPPPAVLTELIDRGGRPFLITDTDVATLKRGNESTHCTFLLQRADLAPKTPSTTTPKINTTKKQARTTPLPTPCARNKRYHMLHLPRYCSFSAAVVSSKHGK